MKIIFFLFEILMNVWGIISLGLCEGHRAYRLNNIIRINLLADTTLKRLCWITTRLIVISCFLFTLFVVDYFLLLQFHIAQYWLLYNNKTISKATLSNVGIIKNDVLPRT